MGAAFALSASTPAIAGPTVMISARLGPDLQSIEGELRLIDGAGLRLADPQGRLPVPGDDQLMRRTFPQSAEQGWVHFEEIAPDRWSFHAILPRRYDAAGYVPGHGLFTNGLWYPQVLDGQDLALLDWQVILTLPAGVMGVLNDQVGQGMLHWSGRADRVALAAVPDARLEQVDLPVGSVTIVRPKGRLGGRQLRHTTQLVQDSWPGPKAPHYVVVLTPSRRRLARPAPGLLFLSDRAFRVSDGLWRYHVPAVRRGLLAAGLPIPDPWLRAFAASALADAEDPELEDLLGWLSWLPQVDTLLYDGRMPFYAEAFDEIWLGDTVLDDLSELWRQQAAPRAVIHRVDALAGEGTAVAIAWRLLEGQSLAEACAGTGIQAQQIEAWRDAAGIEDLSAQARPLDDGTWEVLLEREAPGAPPVPIQWTLDGETQTWLATEGSSGTRVVVPERPKQIRLDPDHQVHQQDLANDRWPLRWTTVAAFYPYEINLTEGNLSASADLYFRRQYNTRWLYNLGLETSEEDLIGAFAGVYHYWGPLADRRHRPFRAWLSGGPSLLDPDFRPVKGGAIALGASLGLAHDTRVDFFFPMKGHRYYGGLSGGYVPGGDRWGSASAGAVGALPLAGRLVLAGKLRTGVATGEVEHRLQTLGGSANVQGLAASAVVGTAKLVGGSELRWQVVRNASVPGPLVWLSDVQLSTGLDLGVLVGARDASLETIAPGAPGGSDTVTALGWTASLALVGDTLGARPALIGVTVADTAWSAPGLEDGAIPELYLRMTQSW